MFQNATLSKTALYTKNRITISREIKYKGISPATLHPAEAYSEEQSVEVVMGNLTLGQRQDIVM